MDAHSGVFDAPAPHADARRQQVGKVLPGETALPAIGHNSFDPRFVLWTLDATRVYDETPSLRVLEEGHVESRVRRVGLVHNGLEVVDDGDAEHASEEEPRLLKPFDDLLKRLAEGWPAEHVPAEARGEDEALDDASRLLVSDEAESTEVDLELVARLTVIDRYRLAAVAETQLCDAEAVEGPVWHHDPAAAQQCLDLR